MKKPAVLFYRCETKCQYQGTLYLASDEPKGVLYAFPGADLFGIPQHFTVVKAGYTPPDEDGNRRILYMGEDEDGYQEARNEYFKAYLALNNDGAKSETDRRAETDVLKANFEAYGTANGPVEPEEPKDPDEMTGKELKAALADLKVAIPAGAKVADLADLLKAELAKAEA